MSECNLHFELPRALILNANDRMHWAEKARITVNLRAMGAIAARQVAPMERAHLTIRVGYSDNRRRDDHNLMPTYKALIDGITEHLLPDDDREHLTGPDLRSRVAGKTGILVLDFEFRSVDLGDENARIAGKIKDGPAVRKHCESGPSHDDQVKETS